MQTSDSMEFRRTVVSHMSVCVCVCSRGAGAPDSQPKRQRMLLRSTSVRCDWEADAKDEEHGEPGSGPAASAAQLLHSPWVHAHASWPRRWRHDGVAN